MQVKVVSVAKTLFKFVVQVQPDWDNDKIKVMKRAIEEYLMQELITHEISKVNEVTDEYTVSVSVRSKDEFNKVVNLFASKGYEVVTSVAIA